MVRVNESSISFRRRARKVQGLVGGEPSSLSDACHGRVWVWVWWSNAHGRSCVTVAVLFFHPQSS
ncbi:hypothetical protein BDP55DRAFT_646822, partial [Colletotrichum godetiae]